MTKSFEDVKGSAYQWANNTPTCGCHEEKSMGVVACYEMCKWLDYLKVAHDAEMKQLSKTEFHRGYEDGKAARDADEWQLDRERNAVVERLRKVDPSQLRGSHEMLSAICKAVHEPTMGWTAGACESLRDRLIALLGAQDAQNATDFAGNRQNGPKSGEKQPEMQKSEPESRDSLREVGPSTIAAERHKAVENLRLWEPDKAFDNDNCGEIHIRILYQLLDLGGAMMMDGADAAKAVRDRIIHLLGGNDGTTSNGNGTCPIAVQSSSITDELRKWVRDHIWQHAIDHAELCAIADRIDEQFERICSQQEAVLQQTISETVAEHECEMAELRHDVEMWRDRAEDMRKERDELHKSLVKVAEHVGIPHERDMSEYDDSTIANATIFCVDVLHRGMAEMDTRLNSLLDLIRDAAEDYQTAARVARRLQERASELRRERDELLDKLQAISVLCEQDDG